MRDCLTALCVVFSGIVSVASAQPSNVVDSAGIGVVDSYRYFDQPIDPDIYLIRPGDELVVTFIKAKIPPFRLAVDPEGRVVNATLGLFDLSQKTLTEAKQILTAALRDLFNVDQMVISVAAPARVGIHVSGAIVSPGLYTAYTSQRVSEIIDSAGGVIQSGSRRHIVLSGGPGDLTVDLDRAKYLGDNSANPCLYAGHSVFVPFRSEQVVQVVGEVNMPREIELVAGDDLDRLLSLAGGVRSGGDTGAVQILGRRSETTGSSGDIRAGDIILVQPQPHSSAADYVTAFGAVVRPGPYEYRGEMTLADLLNDAGGFVPNAGIARTTIFRRAEPDEWGRSTNMRYPLGNVVRNTGAIDQVVLQPADSIIVPVRVGYVKVSGQVSHPGLVPYIEGANALYYIDMAGGYLESARKDRVDIFDRVSRLTSANSPEVRVQDGDEIIVDIREELK